MNESLSGQTGSYAVYMKAYVVRLVHMQYIWLYMCLQAMSRAWHQPTHCRLTYKILQATPLQHCTRNKERENLIWAAAVSSQSQTYATTSLARIKIQGLFIITNSSTGVIQNLIRINSEKTLKKSEKILKDSEKIWKTLKNSKKL